MRNIICRITCKSSKTEGEKGFQGCFPVPKTIEEKRKKKIC